MQKVLETNLCIIYYSDSLQKLADATISLLKNKIKQYKIFFGIDLYEKIIVNYFDNIGDFRKFIYNIRGEKDKYSDKNCFKNFYLKVKEETKSIPDLNVLKHGESFCNNKYNGYDLSYLCVRYLDYILKPDEFRLLMSDFSQIRNYGNKIIYKMFDYFDNMFNINQE